MSHERTSRDSDAAVPQETQLRTSEAASTEAADQSCAAHPAAPSFDKLRGAALSTLWFSVEEPPKSDHEAA